MPSSQRGLPEGNLESGFWEAEDRMTRHLGLSRTVSMFVLLITFQSQVTPQPWEKWDSSSLWIYKGGAPKRFVRKVWRKQRGKEMSGKASPEESSLTQIP